MARKNYEMDMCNGPLMKKLLIFSLPLMLSSMLQLLFNAADVAVVGRFVGSQALAAVGSTTSLINLQINLFVGFSVGVNVLVSRYYGAREEQQISETIHTAIALSLVSGVFLAVMGIIFAPVFLGWMGTPEDVIPHATLYLRIYFAGMPVIMLYNFGSAILRSVGDTRRPLYYLTLAGVVNVILNLFFVIVVGIGVAGVALATIIAQAISAALVLRCLVQAEGGLHLEWRAIRFHRQKLLQIIRTGLPAGLQGTVFSLSNVVIQSSLNTFGSVIMAGNAAALNLENFIFSAMNAFHHGALCFTGQNVGGGKMERVGTVLRDCLLLCFIFGMGMGMIILSAGEPLLGLYSTEPEVILYGMKRLQFMCPLYFICGWMDVMVGSLRGQGYSIMPMCVSMLGACGLRLLWIATAFAWNPTLIMLYMSYPVSWTITALTHLGCFWLVRTPYRKTKKQKKQEVSIHG